MNKRIISILLSLVMMLSMVATAVPVLAAPAQDIDVILRADKTEAHPGDTVNYTISIGAVNLLGGLDFWLKIPDGLTIVDSSVALPDGLETTLDSDGAIVYPMAKNGYRWSYSAQDTGYTGNSELVILTFACTVDADCEKEEKDVTIDMDVVFDNDELNEIPYTIQSATVTITAKPVAVTGVTIDETLSVKTGELKTPSYTVNPAEATNKAVSFKSDNPAVATVNATTGEVTGVKEGTATITITTADGNFTDTCVVTVACSHANKTPVAEKASDCKNKGWDAYVKCDDCGQLFAEDGTTEIAEIPFRALSSNHTGGTATCTAQAVCTVCGNPYGDLAAHSYTSADKKAEALKSEGNCRDVAVYYYSCSACGTVENNDSHTFNGDKVPGTHVGGTALVNQSEENHKTQTDGYTGDTKCLGCNEIIGYGQPIPAGAHTPANVWSTDGQYHWKECTVVGCGIVIDGSKAEHSSTGANVATCQKAAVCDVCGVSYGTVADHDWNTSSWEKDATGHWHKCNTAGCTEKNAFAAHTPDHQGGATEEYAIKCTICQFEIEAQLGHTHVFDQEVVADRYLASKANCTDPAKYYKSCRCGEKGTDTFTSGAALGHTEGTEWEKDATGHWHICTVAGCGVIIDTSKAEHTPDRREATLTDPILCSVCGWEIAPKLVDNELTVEIPFTVTVKKTGDLDPAKETFTFKMFDLGYADTIYTVEGLTVETNGVNTYNGKLVIKVKESQFGNLSEGFKLAQIKGSSEGWTYDETVYYIAPQVSGTGVTSFTIYPENAPFGNDTLEKVEFTNSYAKAQEPTQPGVNDNKPSDDVQSPQTGDNSMMWLWVALLFVSGFGVVATTVLGKKRFVK